MSAGADYFRVGVFVILALTLGVAMLVTLGAGRFWREQILVETYFDESVQGVDVGTPIKYRGVTVGSVEKIDFVRAEYEPPKNTADAARYDRYVLVRFAIRPEVFASFTYADDEPLRRLIEQGLRVRLASQGLTGLMYIEADYLEPSRNPPLPISWKPANYYVPSAPSVISRLGQSMDQVMQRIEQADLLKLAAHLDELLLTVTQNVQAMQLPQRSAQVGQLIGDLATLTQEMRTLVTHPEIPRLLTAARQTTEETRQMLQSVQQTVRKADHLLAQPAWQQTLTDVAGAARNLDTALATLPDTLQRLQRLAQRADNLLAREDQSLGQTLEHVRLLTQQLSELATKLNTQPTQVLFGSPPPAIGIP